MGNRAHEAGSLFGMSLALNKLRQRVHAISHAEEALKIYEQIEDPDTVRVQEQLAKWRKEELTHP